MSRADTKNLRIAVAVAAVVAALLLVLASSDARAASSHDVFDLSSSQTRVLFGQAPIAVATGAAGEPRVIVGVTSPRIFAEGVLAQGLRGAFEVVTRVVAR